VITSGFNGYTAGAGYNLVTGLGTPVANSLVSDLVAYHGPGTSYAGPTVGPLQNTTLTSIGPAGTGVTNAFAVFSALTVSNGAFGENHALPAAAIAGASVGATTAQSMMTDQMTHAPLDTASATSVLAASTLSPNGFARAQVVGLTTAAGTLSRTTQLAAGIPSGLTSTVVTARAPWWMTAQNSTSSSIASPHWGDSGTADSQRPVEMIAATTRTRLMSDSILDELAAESAPWQAPRGHRSIVISIVPPATLGAGSISADRASRDDRQQAPSGFGGRLAALGLAAAGLWGRGIAARNRRSRKLGLRRKQPGSSSGKE
jgi:hypothetical protein